MPSDSRYDLLETVGTGSFATVYRARDNELGREVAIKQIHEQFLRVPEQMDRYWQEAQLLAQLQHPNIITFFDIDRERGWLIMELMQGNLADRITTEPLDLKSVRTSLAHCLRALKYLHAQGIVHGDIKPANMMIDSRKRIKIGDFGLSRRVSDEDGSLLKGTTKYMAPEVMSEEFGEVGPPSDLYSLGFSAYELMCGPNFETLFPGLNAFGRDKQVGWMMWHAAPDRTLPEISRVLEGVPEDLAQVVQKLVSKVQSQRYQTAADALSDLQIDLKIVKSGKEAPEEPPVDNTRRTVAIAAFCASLILSMLMLFLPGDAEQQKKTVEKTAPVEGVVGRVEVDRGFFTVTGKDGIPQEIRIGEAPRILLNGKTYITPRELQSEDRVVIQKSQTDDGQPRLEIAVSRPASSTGYVTGVQPSVEQLTLQITEGSRPGKLAVRASGKTRITLNGKQARLAELRTDDKVTVHHVPHPELSAVRLATEIVALQERRLDGFLRDITESTLTIETNRSGRTELVELPFESGCDVTINGQKIVDGRLLKTEDLKAGDRVTATHHTEIVEVNALRQFLHAGKVLEVQPDSFTLIVSSDGEESIDRMVFVATDDSPVTINGEPAELTDLRRADKVELSYDRTRQQNDVSAIDALRPVNDNRFAIVIGIQEYDDQRLTPRPWSAADAEALHETLQTRYACRPEQILLLVNENRVRIEQAVPDWLRKADADSELIFFFAGHAYVDDEGEPYLAATDFDLSRTTGSGLALRWLRERLEACPARQKLLLLDCSRPGNRTTGGDESSRTGSNRGSSQSDGAAATERQPSTARMIESLKPEKHPAEFRSTWAIASSAADQHGLSWDEKQHGLFGWFVTQGFSGEADENRDLHLEPTELFDYLRNEMAQVKIDGQVQLPKLFRPDATPPAEDRLSPEARDAIRNLLAAHWTPGSRRGVPAEAAGDYLAASRLAEDEPDAQLAWALIQLRHRDDREAEKHFERLGVSHPSLLLPYEALAWLHADDGDYSESIAALTILVRKLKEKTPGSASDSDADSDAGTDAGSGSASDPTFDPASDPASPKKPAGLDQNARRILAFAGRLREFASTIPEKARQPADDSLSGLDKAVASLPDEAVPVYESSRAAVREKIADYEKRLKAAKGTSDATLIDLERKRIEKYVTFDAAAARRAILAGLDNE